MDFLKTFISQLRNNKPLLKPEVKSNEKESYPASDIAIKKSTDFPSNILQSNADVEVTQYSNACSGIKIVKKISKESLTETDNKTTKNGLNESVDNVQRSEDSIKNDSHLSSLEQNTNKADGVSNTKVIQLVDTQNRNNKQCLNNEQILNVNNNLKKIFLSDSLLKTNKNYNNTNNTSIDMDKIPTRDENVTFPDTVDELTCSIADLNNNSKSQKIHDQTQICLKEFDDVLAEVQNKDSFSNAEAPSLDDVNDILEKELKDINNTQSLQEIKHDISNIVKELFETVITRRKDLSEKEIIDHDIDIISLSSDETPNIEIDLNFEAIPKEAIENFAKEKLKLKIIYTDDTASSKPVEEMNIATNCKDYQDECIKRDVKESDQTNTSKITNDEVNEQTKFDNPDSKSICLNYIPNLNTAGKMEFIVNGKTTQDEYIRYNITETDDTTNLKLVMDDVELEITDVEKIDTSLNTDAKMEIVADCKAIEDNYIKENVTAAYKTTNLKLIRDLATDKIKLDTIDGDQSDTQNTAGKIEDVANCNDIQDEYIKYNVTETDTTNTLKLKRDLITNKIKLGTTDGEQLNTSLNAVGKMEDVNNCKAFQDKCIKYNVIEADKTNYSKLMCDSLKEQINLSNFDVISISSDDSPTTNIAVETETSGNTNFTAARDKRTKKTLETDNNAKVNKHNCDRDEKLEVISINSDSEDDCGYHSSDFEFISEEEAKLDGFIINFDPKTHAFKSYIKGQNSKAKQVHSRNDLYAPGPSSRNAGRYNNCNSLKDIAMNKSYKENNYAVPEENELLNMFHGIIPAMPPSEIHCLENKSVRVRAPMLVQYEGIGFDMNLAMQRVDSSDEEYRDEAKESLKKILELYPNENTQRKRRRRY